LAQLSKLGKRLTAFIEQQHLFFVATAGSDGRVNVSPKGMGALKVVDDNHISWLNLSGSGNETAAHVLENGRMTLMFCSFEGDAMILRVYGAATVVHPNDEGWEVASQPFPNTVGNRQIFNLEIDLVQTSCGTGVPVMEFKADRVDKELVPYFEKMGQEGVEEYWHKKNAVSIDGKSTGIVKN